MRAFTLDSFESQPALRADLPEPSPAANEIVVRVHASSVNPVEAFIGMGALGEMFEHEFPVILGRDFAGVVEQVGDGVSRYGVGDEVFGFVPHADPTVHAGSWAELIVLPEDDYAAVKPEGVDAPPPAPRPSPRSQRSPPSTRSRLPRARTCSSSAQQEASAASSSSWSPRLGANVIASALPEDESYLRDLGVSEILDRNADLATAVREAHPDGVDALFDVVSQAPDASLLKDGGRLASPLGAAGEGEGRFNVMAVSSPTNLRQLGELLADGTLRVPIQRAYTLDQAGEALQALATTHTQGKLSITIA